VPLISYRGLGRVSVHLALNGAVVLSNSRGSSVLRHANQVRYQRVGFEAFITERLSAE
jgi:hypothetical protein